MGHHFYFTAIFVQTFSIIVDNNLSLGLLNWKSSSTSISFYVITSRLCVYPTNSCCLRSQGYGLPHSLKQLKHLSNCRLHCNNILYPWLTNCFHPSLPSLLSPLDFKQKSEVHHFDHATCYLPFFFSLHQT